jgi:hypothetical protein
MPSLLSTVRPFLNESQLQLVAESEARGEARGEAKGKAGAVLEILTNRGFALTDDQRRRVLGCEDLAMLDRWIRRALTVTAADELFE